MSGVGKTKLYAISPYDITLVVKPRIAPRDVFSSDAVVTGRVVIVDTLAVVSVCMVMDPVTVVVERLGALEEVKLELRVVVVLVEEPEDIDDEKPEERLVDDGTLTGGTNVLNTVEEEVPLLKELEKDVDVVLVVV
jgi:hypothetical protein